MIAAAVVTTVLVSRSGGASATTPTPTPPPSTSETSSTPTPTPTPTTEDGAEDRLLAALPPVYRGNASCRADDGYRQPGSQAAVLCTAPNQQNPHFSAPTEAYFYSFTDRAAQDAFFQQLVAAPGLKRDDTYGGCSPLKRTGVYGLYYRGTSGPLPGDYLTCFVLAGAGQLWWVDTRGLTVGELSSPEADDNDGLDRLYYWWNEEILQTLG